MRIRIAHSTTYRYEEPLRSITQVLRLTPRDSDSQHVMSWRVSMSTDGLVKTHEDAYGNIVLHYEAEGPLDELTILVEGTVNTFDTAGVLRGQAERLPEAVFLRDSGLALADESIGAFADTAVRKAATPLDRMHMLLDALHERLKLASDPDAPPAKDPARPAPRLAAETFTNGTGDARDLAHVFIAAARHLEMPARIVTGYVASLGEVEAIGRLHAWAEAYVPDYGWIGCDVGAGNCADATYVRLAVGLDYADATPVRGARKGGGTEAMSVIVHVSAQQ